MENNKHLGYCRICNKYGKLTFEHIPPRCALNDKEARVYTGDSFNLCVIQIDTHGKQME